ncbi:acyltransferase family protein [Umezawaea sp. NPDC059074]|uniref:acyltransferase family protein n=1 Tax=Umezawaea sp. NPDC059074 TaxID=3346716 RepID=UPI00368C7389
MLRAIAVCLVVYSHVVGIWLNQRGDLSGVAAAAHEWNPLALTLNVGNFGVVLFFLVSGFIVTHTGVAERPGQYVVKRLLRIYPMLAAAVLLSAGLFEVGLHPLTTGDPATITPTILLTNASLVNYLLRPRVVLVDVAWSLVVEILFYALLLVALPLLRRTAWPVVLGELAVVAAVLASAPLGLVPLRVVENVGYLPALLLGQIAWAVSSKRIPLWTGLPLAALAWGEYAWAGLPGLGRQATVYRYDLDLALGLVVFLAALAAERTLRPTAWFGYLADRSYSLYLLHGLLAVVVLNALYPVVGYPVALAAGLAVTMLGVEVVHRYVERPSMRLARRLTDRW